MDKIREFVDAMFAGLPRTREAAEMRENIRGHMEEEYRERLAAGHSENEALGAVISQFGSMEELRRELGTAAGMPAADPALVGEFEAFQRKSACLTALAVAMYILAPITVMLFETLRLPEGPGNIIFVVIIAAATGLLVYLDSRKHDYERRLGLDKWDGKRDGKQTEEHEDPVVAGVAILATAVFLLLGFLYHLWHPGWLIFLIIPVAALFRKACGSR